jgi:hypothetical protein
MRDEEANKKEVNERMDRPAAQYFDAAIGSILICISCVRQEDLAHR